MNQQSVLRVNSDASIALRIVATTDLHSHILAYDYHLDRPVDNYGLSRTATLLNQARRSAQNVLTVDNGDFLNGSPLSEYIARTKSGLPDYRHPMIEAMNLVGFDAAALGNHEFNHGLDYLEHAIAAAEFPILSANVLKTLGATPLEDETLFPPYVLLDRDMVDTRGNSQCVRVALIGFCPPQITNWDRHHLTGRVFTRDIVETARAYIPHLKSLGADVIIALSHSGIAHGSRTCSSENACVDLAEIPGLDAIIGGHSHQVFPGPEFEHCNRIDPHRGTICGKPTALAGFWGSHLSVVDLTLRHDAAGWHVDDHDVDVKPIAMRTDQDSMTALAENDPDFLGRFRSIHEETLDYIRRPVATFDTALTSHFAGVANCASVHLVAEAKAERLQREMAGTPHADLPILSASAPFKTGGNPGPDNYVDIPAGEVQMRHVASLYPFPNSLRGLRIKGAALRDWLEWSAGLFNTVEPGARDARLINPDFPIYDFDTICGLKYEIDLSQPARFNAAGKMVNPHARRITMLQWDDRPVRDDMEFLVAANSYRVDSGSVPGLEQAETVFDEHLLCVDVLEEFITRKKRLSPVPEQTWRFRQLPETTVVFLTAPGALEQHGTKSGLALSATGNRMNGFEELRLHLSGANA